MKRHHFLAHVAIALAATFPPTAALPQTAPTSLSAAYSLVLDDCGRKENGGVLFFRAFGGLWPLPSTFVLLDSADRRLEYTDRAFPWNPPRVRSDSSVFFGPKQRLEESWPGVFSQRVEAEAGLCGVEVRRYKDSPEFGQPVVVVSNRYDHLLLVGPITDSLSKAMQCFSLTKRQVDYPC